MNLIFYENYGFEKQMMQKNFHHRLMDLKWC